MKESSKLVLKCYAHNEGDYWAAYCLDLSLYATGETLEEAKTKLDEEIVEYVQSATVGTDAQFFDQLIPRRAPLSAWIHYYGAIVQYYANLMWNKKANMNSAFFNESRLIPAHNHNI